MTLELKENVNLNHEPSTTLPDLVVYTSLVSPAKFMEMYNLDISNYIDFKSTKSGNISYMSFAHALRLFRVHFPNLYVDVEENPNWGNLPIFPIPDDRGYFVKAYVHDTVRKSEYVYFSVRNNYMGSIFPYDKDKSGEKPVGDAVNFDKAIVRAKTKALAQICGIGLKLWTGDDLDQDVVDEKIALIRAVEKLATKYKTITGDEYDVPLMDYTTDTGMIKFIGKKLAALISDLESNKSK